MARFTQNFDLLSSLESPEGTTVTTAGPIIYASTITGQRATGSVFQFSLIADATTPPYIISKDGVTSGSYVQSLLYHSHTCYQHAANAGIAYDDWWYWSSGSNNWVEFKINAVSLSSLTYPTNAPVNTVIGTINVTMSDGSSFTGSYSVNDTTHFKIVGNQLLAATTLNASSYAGLVITATPAVVGNPGTSGSLTLSSSLAIFGMTTSTWPTNADAVPNWQQAISYLGTNPTHWGHGWDTTLNASGWVTFMTNSLSAIATFSGPSYLNLSTPLKVLVTVPMADATYTSTSNPTCFQQITSGVWDSYFVGIMNAVAATGQTVYIRPGIEMNLPGMQFQWQISTSSATWAAGFKAAFQRIYQLAHNQVAGQTSVNGTVVVSWCPGCAFPNTSSYRGPFMDYFPGYAYVDAIGCDIYGLPLGGDATYVNQAPNGVDITLTDILNMCASNNKPFMLGEWGGGNDSVFPGLVASKVVASGVQVLHLDIWNMNFGGQDLLWSNKGATVGTAWHDALATIRPLPA